MIDARERHLRPGGTLIPLRDSVYAVPVEAPDEYCHVVEPWTVNVGGVDLSPGRRFVVNQWWRKAETPVTTDCYFAAPTAWAEIDYRQIASPNVAGASEWVAARDGVMHGFHIWFDEEVGDGVGFSNAPTLPERIYGRAFFPLEEPVAVSQGDRIRGDFAATLVAGQYVLRWQTTVTTAAGITRARYSQSDFGSQPRLPEDLAITRPDYRPSLQVAGKVDLLALQAMADGQSLAAIAERLAQQFPARFANPALALRHVADLSLKYSQVQR
jgi:protein arginine N-methyltransferase 1